MAIDYGTVRTGLAVTDPLRIIATPLDVVPTVSLINYLTAYFKKEEVDEVVIGLPKQLNNKPSSIGPEVIEFVQKFQKTFPAKKISTIDERFTSSIAQQTMIAGGMKKKDRQKRGNTDKISATLILQSYLERKT